MQMTKLIALDLDGTLLNSDKQLSERNYKALEAAAAAGIEIVPATGRFYKGMPEVIRSLPFVRYVITINGAQVLDTKTGETIYEATIPTDEAVAFYEYLDTLPVIYDAYVDGWGWMTDWMQKAAPEYISYIHSLKMVQELRSPVPELKACLKEANRCPQKMQLFTKDDVPYRDALVPQLAAKYPQYQVSTSLPNNIEINSRGADKGKAIHGMAAKLGMQPEETMAFGDGLNDLTMIKAAGIGIAMENGHADVKAAADVIAETNDADGVAKIIEKILTER